MIEIFIISFLALIMFGLIWFGIEWSTHKSQVLDNCDNWDYADFNTFLKYFNASKDQLYFDEFWGSFFHKTNHSETEIHASIIKFHNKGMVLDYISWIKFEKWLKDVRKLNGFNVANRKREKGIWIK